jgi:hypothetical protein
MHNNIKNPNILVRYTIGPVAFQGFQSLKLSIKKFHEIYKLDFTNFLICHNGLNTNQLKFIESLKVPLYAQKENDYKIKPKGVAWKLYPPRLNPDGYELFIDNDLIIVNKIDKIDEFFNSDKTLVLEDDQRAYGKFEKYVDKNIIINSGLFGLPPRFDLKRYMDYYIREWQQNTTRGHESSFTWDEQGIIALALTEKPYILITKSEITKCENEFKPANGLHFIKLNRKLYHEPFANYLQLTRKI